MFACVFNQNVICGLRADHVAGSVGGPYVHFLIFIYRCKGKNDALFCRKGNRGPERLSNLPRITQQSGLFESSAQEPCWNIRINYSERTK